VGGNGVLEDSAQFELVEVYERKQDI